MTSSNEDLSVKCVVWDLDNTIWNGVLLEDGEVSLRDGIVEAVTALDGRGILNSIASKNDGERATAKLKELGLYDYFLFPQINWNSKVASIERIAAAINIGLNSIAFIDDDQAELEEVNFSHPEVLCIESARTDQMLSWPQLNP